MRTQRPADGFYAEFVAMRGGGHLCRAESARGRFLAVLGDNATQHVLNVPNYGKICRPQYLIAPSLYN